MDKEVSTYSHLSAHTSHVVFLPCVLLIENLVQSKKHMKGKLG